MINICHIVDEDILVCKIPYHHQFKEHLTENIPYPQRKWNPEEVAWVIHLDYMETLDDLLTVFFPNEKVHWEEA